MLAWVEDNKHLMKKGTKTVEIGGYRYKVTGLLYKGELCGWCTYVNWEGKNIKATFFKDRRKGRGKYSLIILNADNFV